MQCLSWGRCSTHPKLISSPSAFDLFSILLPSQLASQREGKHKEPLRIWTGYSQAHSRSGLLKIPIGLCHPLLKIVQKFPNLLRVKAKVITTSFRASHPPPSPALAPLKAPCKLSLQPSGLCPSTHLLSCVFLWPLHDQLLHLWSGLWSRGLLSEVFLVTFYKMARNSTSFFTPAQR